MQPSEHSEQSKFEPSAIHTPPHAPDEEDDEELLEELELEVELELEEWLELELELLIGHLDQIKWPQETCPRR